MTTGISLSANTRGANGDPRYDSRLYRWFEAKIAMEGVPPHLRMRSDMGICATKMSAYVRLSTSGTSHASEAWWNDAMGKPNSFVS